ncbi:MAG: SLC13 family permease [bacterium]|nr:SLC13 family permease [bacterium]
MTWEAWLTGITVLGVFGALLRGLPADMVMAGAVTMLVAVGKVTGSSSLPDVGSAVAGLGNEGLVTVAVLFIVVAGLTQTGAMSLIASPLVGQPQSVVAAQLRLLAPVTLLSAFLNNTPVVAMFLPIVSEICKRTGISPSKLYLPIAYAATFGGVCTLIGTSTNLVVSGMLLESAGQRLSMFDLTWVGLPCCLVAIAFLLLAGRWMPNRIAAVHINEHIKRYTVEMIVEAGGPLVGRTIDRAGLRSLPQLFLAEVERDGELLAAVSPTQTLRADDRLVFVGVVESVVDLQKIRGLKRTLETDANARQTRAERHLIEVVVSERCPLVGSTIRDGQFRSTYDAAIVAVGRGSERVAGKIGDAVLQSGDVLLIEANEDFVTRQRNSNHFFLVSGIENSSPPRYERAWIALFTLLVMIGSVATGWLDLLTAALVASGVMISTRCCSISQARQSIDWTLMVVIAASLGLGKAVEQSGLAETVASFILNLAGGRPWAVLIAVYLTTMVFTELITNNAAAILVFPIAMTAADRMDVSPVPYAIAIAIAASAGFATPFGYQTNLMVYGPGGYRFSDYLRLGIPLDLLFLLVTASITPLIWPF